MQISISNLGHQITDDSLNALFATHGTVETASVDTDNGTGQKNGSGRVDMPDAGEAAAAIRKLDGCIINGRAVSVVPAPLIDRLAREQ
jgi:RNA recognition motif-containing protein